MLDDVASALCATLGATGVTILAAESPARLRPLASHRIPNSPPECPRLPALDASEFRRLQTEPAPIRSAVEKRQSGSFHTLLIPLVVDGSLEGAVWAWITNGPSGFWPDRVEHAAQFCSLLASELQTRREQQRRAMVDALAQRLATLDATEQILQSASECALRALQAASVTVTITGPDDARESATSRDDRDDPDPIGADTNRESDAPFATNGHRSASEHQVCAVSFTSYPGNMGTIEARPRDGTRFNQRDVSILERIAGHADAALSRVQRLAELSSLAEAADRERRAYGRVVEWQQGLVRASAALTHAGDVERLIDSIAVELERLLPHRSLAVYVMSDEPDRLTSIRVRESGEPVDVTLTMSIGQGIVGAAVLDSAPLLINNSHLDPRSYYPPGDPADRAQGENLIAAPLLVSDGAIGAVAISREGWRPFSHEEFQAFTSFLPHLATIIHTARLVARNQAIYMSAIRALTATIDAKDPLTRGHSERVARLSRQIASELNLPIDEQDTIELAALLHDIGKIGVPDEILSKPGPLDASERAVMMEHAVLGAEILSSARSREIQRLIPLIRHHHEWYQGGGYPDGLSGDDIPIGAAIIAVADAFDTMTTRRPYREAMPVAAALDEARRNAATQFHPAAVDALTSTIETSSLSLDGHAWPSTPAVTHITPVDVRPVSVLYRIASEIASIGDVDGFLRKTAIIISEELRYPNVSILLPSGDPDHLIVRADVWEMGGASISGRPVPIESSVCGWVYRNRRVANIGDTRRDARFYPRGASNVRSELAAPLTVDGEVIGVLNIESGEPDAFTSLDERMLVAIASQIAPAIQLAQIHDDVKRAAQRDGLTGIYNHASFYSRLEELLNEGQRVALFIFDVEGLKRVNDTAGHLAGDTALRRVAATLDLETRPQDIVARYGGDEFAVIVTDVDEPVAIEMAQRLQAAVRRITWGSGSEHLSISVGVAISGRDGTKATDLVATADKRMYAVRMKERATGPLHAERRESTRPLNL